MGGEGSKNWMEFFVVGDGGVLLVVAAQHAHCEGDLLEGCLSAQGCAPGSAPK